MSSTHHKTTAVRQNCMNCEDRPVLCYGFCGACLSKFRRLEAAKYRRLRKMSTSEKKIEVARMRAEIKAKRQPAWTWEGNESALAAQFGQDSK